MAGSYIKVNDEIRSIESCSIKDAGNNYRIVKNIYAKVNIGGNFYWEKVLNSKPIYNSVLQDGILKISSVEDFGVEKEFDLTSFSIDKIVQANNFVYLHEYNGNTLRVNLNNFSINTSYASNWIDMDADNSGNIYFLTPTSISTIDTQGNTVSYNVSLQSQENFTRFCVDKDGFCYSLTTNDRFIKTNPLNQTTEYSVSISVPVLNNAKLTVDDDNVYIDTDFNLIHFINKNTGNEGQKITNINDEKTYKCYNQDFIYILFSNDYIVKYNLSTNNSDFGYSIASGFTITDFDVSYNGNVYITASDGINYKILKLNNELQEIYNSGNTPVSGNGNFKIGVFPGNVGGGFWESYVN